MGNVHIYLLHVNNFARYKKEANLNEFFMLTKVSSLIFVIAVTNNVSFDNGVLAILFYVSRSVNCTTSCTLSFVEVSIETRSS